MIRTSTKKVAVPLGKGLFRETTIEMEQHYHDNTKKLVKTEEKSRTEGRLLRAAEQKEKASVQLMDADTFEVLSLVEAPESQAVSVQEQPAEEPAEEQPKVASPAQEPSAAQAADVGKSEEDDMAKAVAKKGAAKAKAAAKKKTTTKAKAAPKKAAKAAPKKKKAPAKKSNGAKAAKGNGKPKSAPTSGQSGPPIDLSEKGLNAKELKILSALCNGQGTMTIKELATECFKGKAKAQANSWVRNSLRRPARAGLIEQVERGTYKATAKGKKHAAASKK
jgi:hypothetical protein